MHRWSLVTLGLMIGTAVADDPAPLHAPPALEIFYDFEVYRLLPRKWEFENPEDKLFRSNDGRTLYWGPSAEKSYFVIQPNHQVKQLEAPSVGKAYLDRTGAFALWYDSVDQGIHFKDREVLQLAHPLHGRFGVSYDLNFHYVYARRMSAIYEGIAASPPIIELGGLFTYRLVAAGDQLWVFAFSYLGHEATRSHRVLRFQKVADQWLEMERFDLPDNLTLMDVDPYNSKALFVNEAEIAPQAFEIDLRTRHIHGLGLIEHFAIYLHPDFRENHEITTTEGTEKE